MAEEIEGAEEQQEPKKKGKLKLIIILVVVILGLGAGVFFLKDTIMGMFGGDSAAEEQTSEQAPPPDAEVQGEVVTLPVFLVNLADPLGRRYLKLGLDVELRDAEAVAELNKPDVMARIKDAINILLSSKTYDMLLTVEDKITLKQEIVDRLNQVLGQGQVLRVYITEMLIQ